MAAIPTDPATARKIFARIYQQQEQAKRDAEQAEAAAKSFRAFIPLAWHVAFPAKPYVPNTWHLDAIGEHLQAVADKQIHRLLVIVPPGAGKSTLCSVMFPAWKWIKDPKWRSVWASYPGGPSDRDSVACRDLLMSEWYQTTFKPTWKPKSDQWEKTYYYNTEKGFRQSTTVDSGTTGFRGHLLGIDDAHSTQDRFSPVKLDGCVRWFKNVWFNRQINSGQDAHLVIGQRVADNDLIGHLLREGGWEVLLIPMEYDPARSMVTSLGWKDPRTVTGELMCESVFPRSEMDRYKLDSTVWSTQYQGLPSVEGGGMLKSHCWNYWQPPGMNLPPVRVRWPDGRIEERKAIDLPESFDLMLSSWDCTFGKSDTSDFVCGQAHAIRGAKRFLIDQILKRMGITETMAAIREMTARYPKAHLKILEKAANATAAVELLADEIPGMVLERSEGNKVAYAAAAAPEVEAGNWYLPHPMIAPWVGNPENALEGGFLASTTLFPFGPHDDDVDSWSHGAKRMREENIGGQFGVSEKDIRVDPLPVGEKWARLFGLSITWREVGAVWICREPNTSQHYLYAEHFAPAADPAQHAKIIRETSGVDWITGFMHVTDEGRVERDGFRLIKKFNDLGVKAHAILAGDETELLDLSEALRNGTLKVFGSCARFFDQFRMYRRSDSGALPKENAGLIRAACVGWAGRAKMKGVPEVAKADRIGTYQDQDTAKGGWMV